MKRKTGKILWSILIAGILFTIMFFVVRFGTREQNDIVILYTNDVHCGIEENIGYAGLAAYKESMEEKTPYVTLVDCGDAVQGDFIGLTSEGSYIVDIMNEVGYDFAVIGNHEFDYGMERLSELIQQSEAKYLGCNIQYTGESENKLQAVKPYDIVKYGKTKVAFIGVTTPQSISSSTPTYFMEDDEYVYEFSGAESGEELYICVQNYVDECRKQGADYVIVLAHLGDGEEYAPYSSNDLVKATEGIDVVLDGHAHSTIPNYTEKNKLGEEVFISSTGTKLANIGQLVITADGSISTELISDYIQKDEKIKTYIDIIQATYEEDLKKVVATAEVALSGYSEDGIRLVRNRETNIGNFCADAYRYVAKADIALVNGGGIRADLPAGEITYEDLFAVHPFGNTLCMVEATGQEILDCLEMCYRVVLAETSEDGNAIGEDGGFQQVSGLQFWVDTSVESSVVIDENEMFVSVGDTRRVKDVLVLNDEGEYEPLDVNKVYTLASHDYLLKEGGSGCQMFMDNPFIIDEGMLDYQVLVTYMTEALGGKIDTRYGKTEGRINVGEQRFADKPNEQGVVTTSTVGLSLDGTHLVDNEGNPIQLRGVSTHGLAWFPQYVNQEFFTELHDEWNANVVRLAMYTAENGGYCSGGDKENLKQIVKDGVEYATNAGLYVIIDWHILQDNNPQTNKEEAKKFFEEMSKEFSDSDNVLYEICNEPNGGTSWTEIKSYAEEIIPIIRANDEEAIIIVGTPTWSQEVDKAVADPIKGYENIMYTLHFYAATHTDWLRERMENALSAGLPIFVTEFGTCDASGNGGIDINQSNEWIKTMDENGVSYVAWNLSNKNETSAIFKSDCQKTSGFTADDLTDNGKWIYEMLTGEHVRVLDTKVENVGTTATTTEPQPEPNNSKQSSGNSVSQGKADNLTYIATVSNSWQADGKTVYQYTLTIENQSDKDVENWSIDLKFNENITFSDGWNGNYSVNGATLIIGPKEYNTKILAGEKISDIGFMISGSEKLAIVK